MTEKLFRVAILTAKEVEFDAVRRHLVEERREDGTYDGTVYRLAKFRKNLNGDAPDPKWSVAIYRTGRGQQPTTYGTQVLLQHFKPHIVLYVGVAGGDPSQKELAVGDVVVAKIVRYYERTSQRENDFIIKEQAHQPNRALISAAEFEADDSGWLERINGARPNTRVFVEEIASGDKVQKSSFSPLWQAIKEKYSDVIAVETEGHGFHYAVEQSAGRGIMVRAISDLLDNKDDDGGPEGSDDDRQALASKNAAAFAVHLVSNLNTTFLEQSLIQSEIRYSIILKISANSLEGIEKATQILSIAVNDPDLKLESLQPANSFIIRVSTNLRSAAYASAMHRGKMISDVLSVRVLTLQSDAEKTGEAAFDEFLSQVKKGSVTPAIARRFREEYPTWSSAVSLLEKSLDAKKRKERTTARKNHLYYAILQQTGDKKINVIKALRDFMKLGLKEARDIAEAAPQLIGVYDDLRSANRLIEQLQSEGAEAKLMHSKEDARKLLGRRKQLVTDLSRFLR